MTAARRSLTRDAGTTARCGSPAAATSRSASAAEGLRDVEQGLVLGEQRDHAAAAAQPHRLLRSVGAVHRAAPFQGEPQQPPRQPLVRVLLRRQRRHHRRRQLAHRRDPAQLGQSGRHRLGEPVEQGARVVVRRPELLEGAEQLGGPGRGDRLVEVGAELGVGGEGVELGADAEDEAGDAAARR